MQGLLNHVFDNTQALVLDKKASGDESADVSFTLFNLAETYAHKRDTASDAKYVTCIACS